jgi:hypothetical protein
MSEQRQSVRFKRRFLVTDYQDEAFELAFDGWNVNLTGLSFIVPDKEMFLPGQPLALRVRSFETNEDYALDSVEVVHLREQDGLVICGCHITQMSNEQLLAHQRVAMLDPFSVDESLAFSQMDEFSFDEQGSSLSSDVADYHQAGFALNLAVEEVTAGLQTDETSWAGLLQALESLAASLAPSQAVSVNHLIQGFKQLHQQQETRNEQVLALSLLAKMLVHTPSTQEDRLSWQTLIRDFETRFLDERLLLAYDLMHQGLEAREALNEAERQLAQEQD